MNLHNTMEDIVLSYLEEILNEVDGICKCERCKFDMACFVLNKIQPKYIISSRGIVHSEKNLSKDNQEYIDIYSIVMEAIKIVSKSMRHSPDEIINDDISNTNNADFLSSPFFYNFPQIVGRVIDSNNLDSIKDAKITLNYDNNELVDMFNENWKNPIALNENMEGYFSFWPKSLPADSIEYKKDFKFNMTLEKDGFEKISKPFVVSIISTNKIQDVVKKENAFHLNEIYMYPEGLES